MTASSMGPAIDMSRRLKLIVAYDGAPFAGWQSQPHRNTIQDYLERAFERVIGRPVRVHGAGRTDAGVHALAQCAHVDVNKALAPARWMEALNALLPPAIRVLRCRYVSNNFFFFQAEDGIRYGRRDVERGSRPEPRHAPVGGFD